MKISIEFIAIVFLSILLVLSLVVAIMEYEEKQDLEKYGLYGILEVSRNNFGYKEILASNKKYENLVSSINYQFNLGGVNLVIESKGKKINYARALSFSDLQDNQKVSIPFDIKSSNSAPATTVEISADYDFLKLAFVTLVFVYYV